jgi:hypothetical protein
MWTSSVQLREWLTDESESTVADDRCTAQRGARRLVSGEEIGEEIEVSPRHPFHRPLSEFSSARALHRSPIKTLTAFPSPGPQATSAPSAARDPAAVCGSFRMPRSSMMRSGTVVISAT